MEQGDVGEGWCLEWVQCFHFEMQGLTLSISSTATKLSIDIRIITTWNQLTQYYASRVMPIRRQRAALEAVYACGYYSSI
jgi:hypothetical protein